MKEGDKLYRVIIINNGDETIVNEPIANQDAPKVTAGDYHNILSQPDSFDFTIPIMNPGWGKIKGLKTKVKVIDTRDNSVLFTGRVVPYKDREDSSGVFDGQSTCEGALGYLNDSLTRRWHLANKTPTEMLQYFLDKHNSTMGNDSSRKIYLGIVEPSIAITVDTNFETTLNAIITKLVNILGGDIRVQEREGILYLDYLNSIGEDREVSIIMNENMNSITRENDPSDLCNRLICHGYGEGINQLDIKSVNNNIDYVEDEDSIAEYGVIEGHYTNSEIQNAYTLMKAGETALKDSKQPKVTLDTSMIDRSVLEEYSFEKYNLGDTLHIINSILDIDVYARVTEEKFSILSPWNKDIVISTRPLGFIDQIVELKQRTASIENAPQGSTYIDTFGYAENIDASHSFQLPIWLSPDILNVNRVRLHVDSQKYRAYEKGLAGGGGTTSTTGPSSKTTSDSGGQSTQTSSSGGSSTQTSSSAGQSTQTSSSGGGGTQTSSISSGLSSVLVKSWEDVLGVRQAPDNLGQEYVPVTENGSTPSVDLWWFHHTHNIDHSHDVTIPNHTHTVTTPAHTHSVDIPAHTHSVEIPNHSHGMDHTHSISIPDHTHAIEYGIFEDTYPTDVQIKINGQVIPDISLSEGGSLDIDISHYVGIPGETYNLEVTSSRNGRVNVWVSIQAFIQIK